MALELLDLPSEILALVFRHLRAYGLHSTLAVSKQWKAVAEPVAYEYARLPLMRRDVSNEPWNLPTRTLGLIRKYNQHLAVLLPSYTIRDEVHPGEQLAKHPMQQRVQWLDQELLSRLTRPKSVSIRRGSPLPGGELKWIGLSTAGNDQYLRVSLHDILPVINTLTAMSTLTFVGIDLRPKDLDQSSVAADGHDCLCKDLGALMRRTMTFYLRLPCICPKIFQAPPHQPESMSGSTEAVINISMGFDDDLEIEHATGCPQTMGGNKSVNPASMQEAARAVVEKTPSIKTLRIVYHTYPMGDAEAYDAVSKQRYRVSEQSWTEHGSLLDINDASDSDLFDDVDIFSDSTQ
ncbi:hypothetical protein BDZ85DRAFT_246099 [Elsinoe ampelina]|uniref:F-box domain-containing protein n=1 Tax=Elsinoe ampelina TaxID=302913 RepID=A0A6A6GPE0_9PEZI|nr:hypothetical protein BDZ85DRAFT_246099 [Elsinoe ampelina]